jgi:demethylmenaquinone methyltransferase / 2-methoxy-6-polyprenyl-1,4-benzoquinol methylase
MTSGHPSPAKGAAATPAARALLPRPPLPRHDGGETERRRRTAELFNRAAADYDWITQAMSFGLGHSYRRRALLAAGLARGMNVLDVGCGTGVMAAHSQAVVGAAGRVAALDPSLGMLRRAGGRGVRLRVGALAEALPFAEGSFDLLVMGYALRHVADLRAAFGEFRRVLRGGGRLLLLEITPPPSRAAFRLVKIYLGRIVPLLSRLRGGQAAQALMEYYWETIERCVQPAVIVDALAETGFRGVGRQVEKAILSEYSATR